MATVIIGLILIAIGLSALIGLSLLKLVFAIVLIAIGLSIITGRRNRHWYDNMQTSASEDYVHEVVIFSGLNKVINSLNFRGGRLVFIFGGGEVDLSKVQTTHKEIDLEVVAIFGGCKLIVPREWKINTQGTAIFGGYNSKEAHANGNVVLNLKGAAIFGGVDVVN